MSIDTEKKEHSFSVRKEKHGTFVTDLDNGREFFQTPGGGWFWLTGPENPFDEDATVMGKPAEYLDQIVQTSQETLLKSGK